MRIENAGSGPAPFESLEAVNRFKGYISALRRRWYLVFIPMVLGATLGWLTTPHIPTVKTVTGVVLAGPTYYRASHILIDESQGSTDGSGVAPVNLAQAAYLVNTGEVPKRVAAKVNIPVDDVSTSVIGLPRPQVSSIEVQAVGTDPERVVQIADASAAELLATLLAQAKTDANQTRDLIIAQLDKLDSQITDLNNQIASNPPNRDQLDAQQRSLTNQYSLIYEQFAQLANRPAPSAGLTSLEGAKAVKISKATFDRAKTTIRDGADYVTGNVPATTVPDSGSVDATPNSGAGALTRAVFGGLTGMVLGIGLVLLLDRFETKLRRRRDVEAITGLSVIAEIPPLKRHQQSTKEVVAHSQIRSRAAEAYRVVRGALLFGLAVGTRDREDREGATVVMVTSANPAEGKTTTTANLAAVLAEGGFNVLVINCDFRRPQVHNYLLGDPDEAREAAVVARVGSVLITKTIIDRVQLVTGLGEDDPDANPLDVVAMQRKVIEVTRASFDMILLDTAPLLTTNDASELFSLTDQVVMVVRAGKTKAESARRAAEVLGRFDAPVIGVVLNGSEEAESAQYYYGTYTTKSLEPPAVKDDKRPAGTGSLPVRTPLAESSGGAQAPEVGARS